MAEESIHPVLTNPIVAATVVAIAGIAMSDAGISELLQRTGETTLNATDWSTLVNVRWTIAIVSAALGGIAWWLMFRLPSVHIKRPWAGVLIGICMPIMGLLFVLNMYTSISSDEFANAAPIISKIAFLWSALTCMAVVGCVRLGMRSLKMVRGQQ